MTDTEPKKRGERENNGEQNKKGESMSKSSKDQQRNNK